MPATSDHPCFVAPANKDAKIWRYMDFTKFVSLLENCALYLSRADQFEDPFEGSVPLANSVFRESLYFNSNLPLELIQRITKESSLFVGGMRRWTYINCWHMNDHESAAMWKLYAKSDEAVAIQSTYCRLHDALPDGTNLGTVTYLDYNKAAMPDGNSFWRYVHKRLSFEHEREIRIVEQVFPTKDGALDLERENNTLGKTIEVNLDSLIESVYVSPNSPAWFYSLVQSVIKRYGHGFTTIHSDILREPVY